MSNPRPSTAEVIDRVRQLSIKNRAMKYLVYSTEGRDHPRQNRVRADELIVGFDFNYVDSNMAGAMYCFQKNPNCVAVIVDGIMMAFRKGKFAPKLTGNDIDPSHIVCEALNQFDLERDEQKDANISTELSSEFNLIDAITDVAQTQGPEFAEYLDDVVDRALARLSHYTLCGDDVVRRTALVVGAFGLHVKNAVTESWVRYYEDLAGWSTRP